MLMRVVSSPGSLHVVPQSRQGVQVLTPVVLLSFSRLLLHIVTAVTCIMCQAMMWHLQHS